MKDHSAQNFSWLSPGVLVHRGNNHCTPFNRNLCLAVEHFWFFLCEPVQEDRTIFVIILRDIIDLENFLLSFSQS